MTEDIESERYGKPYRLERELLEGLQFIVTKLETGELVVWDNFHGEIVEILDNDL